jgi:ACS family glucarate transporter-like MFS transporter
MNETPRSTNEQAPTSVRYLVLVLLCLMAFILYLDRIGFSQAVKDIEEELGLEHWMMGLVMGAFTLAYGLFEVPTGHWGDRYGSRKVLIRIVLWWSVFTMLTGLATGFVILLIIRFIFGAGEAGAFPNAVRVVSRWFPIQERSTVLGIMLTAALLGGALSNVIAERLIHVLGWRWMFFILGVPGFLWAIAFSRWFRDEPAEHPLINEQERNYITAGMPQAHKPEEHPPIPWGIVLRQPNIWLLGSITTCSAFTTYMFFFWYPTYLRDGRGVPPEEAGQMPTVVLLGGALGSFLGGYLSEFMVRLTGERKRSRRIQGVLTLSSAGAAMIVSIYFGNPWLAAACATWACLAVHLQLPAWWSVVTETTGKHLGALFGLMNAMGVFGAFISPIFLGAFVDFLGKFEYTGREQWDPAFYVYGGVLFVGALCWLFVDPNKSVVSEEREPVGPVSGERDMGEPESTSFREKQSIMPADGTP